MSPDRMSILRCPDSGTALVAADPKLIDQINGLMCAGRLKNRAGHRIEKKLDGGLLRQDGSALYPVIDQIPVLLKDEAIPLGKVE